MNHNTIVKIPCPVDNCPNTLIIDVYYGHKGSFDDPSEGACINDVSGCGDHYIDDDILIDLALSQAVDDEEEAYERHINNRIDEARGK